MLPIPGNHLNEAFQFIHVPFSQARLFTGQSIKEPRMSSEEELLGPPI